AGPGRRAAHCPRVACRVLTGVARAVAGVGRAGIGVVGAGCAGGLLAIAGAGGTRARARLGRVALARRRAADGARGLEGVAGTVVARAVAGLGDVADARGRPTDGAGSALGVDGAGRADPRTGLGRVADTRRSAADRAGVTGRVGTHPGAAHISSAHVALVGAARAIGDVVGLAGGAAVAGIGLVAVRAGARAAARPRGLEAVGGAGGVGAIAGLGYVALPGRRTAHCARVTRIVHACRCTHGAVAQVRRAHVAVVGAARSRRLDRIGGTARARGRERDELADPGICRCLRTGRADGRL